jgi:hypothetical protein
MATACQCAACRFRRVAGPLVLIALGGLLLAHMASPGFRAADMVAGFLVFLGVLGVIARLLPRPADHPLAASIFFPVLAMAVGGLILARHALPALPLGVWIANYWPVLLILWGLIRLLEHFARPARTRAGLSGGEIFLVIVIVICGLAFSGAYHFRHSRMATYWGVNIDNWNPFLDSYDFSASTRAALPAGAAGEVLVRGYRGDVTVVAGAAGALAAAVSDQVRAESRDAAQNLFQNAQPLIRQEGGQWVVLPAGDASSRALSADLQLTLPANLPLVVQIESGDITVPQWQAPLDLHTVHGAVSAAGAAGNVQVAVTHGSVHLDQVRGNVIISGGGDDIAVSNVTGQTRLEGEYVGSLRFRNLAGGLRFHSNRTALDVAALPGSLTYDLGEISLDDAAGIQLQTRNVEVNIRGFRGPLQVDNRNESVSVASDAPLAAPIHISDRNADIRLTLAPGSRFQLAASADNGDVVNGFGDLAHTPGAPEVSLRTTSGTISLRPSSAPNAPAPPSPPSTPHP